MEGQELLRVLSGYCIDRLGGGKTAVLQPSPYVKRFDRRGQREAPRHLNTCMPHPAWPVTADPYIM